MSGNINHKRDDPSDGYIIIMFVSYIGGLSFLHIHTKTHASLPSLFLPRPVYGVFLASLRHIKRTAPPAASDLAVFDRDAYVECLRRGALQDVSTEKDKRKEEGSGKPLDGTSIGTRSSHEDLSGPIATTKPM